MKLNYWVLTTIIVVTFALGYKLGQHNASQLPNHQDSIDTQNEPSTDKVSDPLSTIQNNIDGVVLPKTSKASLPLTNDLTSEIDNLLNQIKQTPNDSALLIALMEELSPLSVSDLTALASRLKNKDGELESPLVDLILAELLKDAPEKVIAFAQEYSPMAEHPYYLGVLKSQVAMQKPDLGFDYLHELLSVPEVDIELSEYSQLINVLAEKNIQQVFNILHQLHDKGVDIKSGLSSLAYSAKTSVQQQYIFNELRKLDNLTIMNSSLAYWIKISPNDVFERLALIEDSHERKSLTDTAFHFWMMAEPELASEYHLERASNKVEAVKNIIRFWPVDKASEALTWLSSKSDIDVNRVKIEYLERLTFSSPEFVKAHLNDIQLDDGEKIDFYRNLYEGFKNQSSNDAEEFVNTLSFKDEVFGISNGNKSGGRVEAINKAFDGYYDYKHSKAFAVALGNNGRYAYSYSVNQSSQQEANQLALSRCDKFRYRHNVQALCEIYAEGDVILLTITP